MSQKSIREFGGKQMLQQHLKCSDVNFGHSVSIGPETDLDQLPSQYPFLLQEKLVAKPDQLIKRRGKAGLLKLNATYPEVKQWIEERRNKPCTVEGVTGILRHFVIETFVPHTPEQEVYVSLLSERDGDLLLFHHEGGVDVGDVDAKAQKYLIPVGTQPEPARLEVLLQHTTEANRAVLVPFLQSLFSFYWRLFYSYLEINPLVVKDGKIYILDLAAKIDETAQYEAGDLWGAVEFPAPFGGEKSPEEQYIADLDSKTGASLKLTVLNPNGRIWTMVAGGGASVVYADTITDLTGGAELANYGEYSGDPSETLTFEYAKTILSLITKAPPRPEGKILLIGGGIANFTNVAETFKGIIRAIELYSQSLQHNKVRIYVRRGGPNYQEGLKMMKELTKRTGLPIRVFGPDTHITAIVGLALKDDEQAKSAGRGTDSPVLGSSPPASHWAPELNRVVTQEPSDSESEEAEKLEFEEDDLDISASLELKQPSSTPAAQPLFTQDTYCFVYGMQLRAVQGMLDFDQVCKRAHPSVQAMIYPFGEHHFQKFYWGSSELLLPVYKTAKEALDRHPNVSVMVNFASSRSVYESVSLTLESSDQIKIVAIIAEGVPENRTRLLLKEAKRRGVTIIGPATVGGLRPGHFRIGNTGGMMDNILASKLYRPGSVGYVSKSGGMSNELNNIISRNSNGVAEGVAIGGDRFPGTTFLDHLLRYEADPNINLLVLLGEVGGTDEYAVCEALRSGAIRKPLVAWCMGTCANMFAYEVQFGHAGALARGALETAAAKNAAMKAAGAIVPKNFDQLPVKIRKTYEALVRKGIIHPQPEPERPNLPMDYDWARKLGLVRKSGNIVSSITDERGDEVRYAGTPLSQLFREDVGIGGVVSLLWFRRLLPPYATKFLEMVLMATADHGPAVSGAHNTIVTTRAGKGLIESLVSGLLTIGPRFGGAIDAAAEQFSHAYDIGQTPRSFVSEMRNKGELIMGIGHKVKSLQNPDERVELLKAHCKAHFPRTPILDFALEVEKVTTGKKPNLILNVDGCIGVCFVDLLRECGAFTREEADQYARSGALNGLFVLGRSIGLIGHHLDQNRLKQGLYRHPWDDIVYVNDF